MESRNISIFKCKWIFYGIAMFGAIYIYSYDLFNLQGDLVFFLIVSGILTLYIGGLMLFIHFKDYGIHKIYFISCILLGIIYLLAAPLFTGSDEHNHYYRIYEISEGVFKTPVIGGKIGSYLPKSLVDCYVGNAQNEERINRNTKINYDDIIDMAKVQLESEEVQYGLEWASAYENTALYSPVSYLPHVFGFLIAKIFGQGPFIIGICGKISNLIVYALLSSLAIKNLPSLKVFIAIILLSPIMMCSATTLSADAFTYSQIILLVSYIEKSFVTHKRLSVKELATIVLISSVLAGCKIVYVPLLVLLIFIPVECFTTTKHKWCFCLMNILCGAIISIMWLKSTQVYFDTYYTNTAVQKNNILHNVLWYTSVEIRTHMINFTHLIKNMFVGTDMYHAQLPIYDAISISYIVIAIIALLKSYIKCMRGMKVVLTIGIMLGIIALTTTAIYIQCTANFLGINNNVIVGLQGRYYLPILLLSPLILTTKKDAICTYSNYKSLFEIMLIIHFYTVLQMVLTFMV